jgi:ParB family transcriptional regulator, chromosome partitioning protein
MKKMNFNIEYEDRIREISVDKIEINQHNPRKKFVETEEDELIESILSKGILNPIIVYRRRKDNKYIILDGERRYRVCKKLNIQKIPAYILKEEPTILENLSLMFHIHNVREEWTDFAIAISLKRVVEEMGKNIIELTRTDIKELKKITSLTEYKIKKYLSFLEYPQDVIDRFLDEEKKERPERGVDPDILMEMHGPIKQIRELFPDIINKYSEYEIINACIKKKVAEVIKNNREFRYLKKSLAATKKKQVRAEVMHDKIIQFIKNVEVSPEQIFVETSETFYLIRQIFHKTESLELDVLNLDLRKVTENEKEELKNKFIDFINIINKKVL